MDGYISGNETAHLSNTLQLLAKIVPLTKNDPMWWRWIAIALHNAIQGACVARLTHTDGTGALTERATIGLQTYDSALSSGRGFGYRPPYPEEGLAPLKELLKRLPAPVGPINITANPPTPSTFGWHMKTLDSLRHDFMHTLHRSHDVEISGMPALLLSGVNLVHEVLELPMKRRPNDAEIDPSSALVQLRSVIAATFPETVSDKR
ncbi:MAG: hypothetical protein WBA25_00590 [Jannaschia sp.]